MIDCIFISNLFPNPAEPTRGLYNRDQLIALSKLNLKIHVLSPLPWFPVINPWNRVIPREAALLPNGTIETLRPPPSDFRPPTSSLPITYIPQLYLPLSRGAQNARLYSWSIRRPLVRLIQEHRPCFLWASFAFPDGVGVAIEAKRHNLPHVISLLGSDINLNQQHPARWKVIMQALGDAKLVFAKSKALRHAVAEVGSQRSEVGGRRSEVGGKGRVRSSPTSDFRSPISVPRAPIVIDYNGVDQDLFCPADRDEACRALGLDPAIRRILFVGNLVPVKDVATLIRAFSMLVKECPPPPALQLAIIGSGPEEPRLRQLASSVGLTVIDDSHTPTHPHTRTLRFIGRLPRKQVSQWMQACDILCLPSLNEGVPNVVLEALACGTPVVATRVGGIPEVHPGPKAGALVEPGDETGLALALDDVLNRDWNPSELRAGVGAFTWEMNASNVMDALRDLRGTAGRKV